MKVILLKAVPKVGKAGDVVDVQDGYASNALFPKKLAIPATQKAMSALQKEKDSKVQASALAQELLEKAIESLPNDEVVITARANEKGHLFCFYCRYLYHCSSKLKHFWLRETISNNSKLYCSTWSSATSSTTASGFFLKPA